MPKKFILELGQTDLTESIKDYPNIVVFENREGGMMYFTKVVNEINTTISCGQSEMPVIITDEHTFTLNHIESIFRLEDRTYYILEVPFY